MFSLRELPSDSTGVSKREILYGKKIRVPLSILKNIWKEESLSEEQQLTYSYVMEMKQNLSDVSELVAADMKAAMTKYKSYYDAKCFPRKLMVGDEVLILLPTQQTKLLLAWKGPFEIIKVLNDVNYVVNVRGKEKVFHINMLKKYFRRPNTAVRVSVNTIDINDLIFPSENLVQRVKFQVLEEPQEKENLEILTVEGNAKHFQELDINPDLNQKENDDLMFLLDEFKIVFSDIPGPLTLFCIRLI